MIAGIGIDSVQIDRIAKSIGKDSFLARVFSEEERRLIAAKPPHRAAETAAGCFAAKEAFLKAAGMGLGGFALSDIAVLRAESGAPYYAPAGDAAQYLLRQGLRAHLSITHEGGLATAFAILERAED